jgi:hypothetical protein
MLKAYYQISLLRGREFINWRLPIALVASKVMMLIYHR